mmetsp:Transcript_14103/g.33487  ORF Transcript_14103/g.33487 Transcript_14103/m.33487 type:complete len:135 (-) Transcript_14103:209-613(-)
MRVGSPAALTWIAPRTATPSAADLISALLDFRPAIMLTDLNGGTRLMIQALEEITVQNSSASDPKRRRAAVVLECSLPRAEFRSAIFEKSKMLAHTSMLGVRVPISFSVRTSSTGELSEGQAANYGYPPHNGQV